MSAILHYVTVRGRERKRMIETYITRELAQEWRDDGLDVGEADNTIPEWWVDAGLPVRLWNFAQDVFHFKNPWSEK